MPRSTKAAPKAATTRRTSKRSGSKQPMYEIPESPSPTFRDDNELKEPAMSRHEIEFTSVDRESSRGRSRGSSRNSSTTLASDHDATPTQSKIPATLSTSTESKQLPQSGLEVLEAVNELYQRLKDAQVEVDRLHKKNDDNSKTIQKQERSIETLRAELKTEKDKSRERQAAREEDARSAHRDAECRLSTVVASLLTFSSAARNIMPLLDVLTGAADIEYDEAAEKLYGVLKEHTPLNKKVVKAETEQQG